MKKYIFPIVIITLCAFIAIHINNNQIHKYSNIQKSISKKIIRFHVIGNSNSTYDQNLKLEIKNSIITYMEPLLKNTTCLKDAKNILNKNLNSINNIAQSCLDKHSTSYTATTSLGSSYFPIKQYGDMTLPEGTYESINVKLGKASGKNWWCVLYPSLCFVDCTYSILPNDSKTKLKTSLTSEEYNYIMTNSSTKVHYESAIFNTLKNILSLKLKIQP